jgi:hypothetical protein
MVNKGEDPRWERVKNALSLSRMLDLQSNNPSGEAGLKGATNTQQTLTTTTYIRII